MVKVTRGQLSTLSRNFDYIAEYRKAKENAAFWLSETNREQSKWAKNILDRLKVFPASDVAICILDTGVNNGHSLLFPVLKDENCQAVNDKWGSHDHHCHGTLMAGVSAYGNLQEILSGDEIIEFKHCLKSGKILPPTGVWI